MWNAVKCLREVQDDEIHLSSLVDGSCQFMGESEELRLTAASGLEAMLTVGQYAVVI